ncbi:MAG TPA: IS1634 family transposase [Streptosporangiaceae bacterium]|nr:IS1634 family transposase [Streptosporangiaceae bacterium]
MAGGSGKVHVVRVSKTGYVDKQGRRKDYSSAYLRRTYREAGTVKNETVANLSALPGHVIDWIDAGLKGQQMVPAAGAVTITGSLPHGHAAAVHAIAAKLGLPAVLGPAGPHRDLAMALIISRVIRPGSKLSTLTWWADTTLGTDLGVADASTDDIYAAMDWLEHRQDAIEAKLAARHLAPQANPSKMALFDLSSSWLEGRCCPLAARGYSRDGKKGKLQIEYGLLTDPSGRPVAVRVFPGNTGDPGAFTEIVTVVRDKFRLAKMVMVGDRGMITSARIQAMNQADDGTQRPDAYEWITALRAPAIRKLMADDGPLQLSLSGQQDLAEITSGDFPGERLIACRNPVLAADRARTREELLAATEKLLAPIITRVQAGRLQGAGPIGVEVGKVITKYKTGKHFAVTITDDSLAVTRKQDKIDAEAALDGFYVLRTPVPAAELDASAVVTAYKNLKYVERDFRHIKSDDLDLRPVFHRLEERVKAHVLICMLACYLTWHLRRAWAPLTYTDQDPPEQDNPVAPARRSATAQAKASYQHDAAGQPYRSFRGLIEHLATLTRNQVRYTGTQVTIEMLTEPTSTQRQAFELIGAPIPLTLK